MLSSLSTCEDGHNPVSYISSDEKMQEHKCPVCEVKRDLEAAEGRESDLEKDVERLEREVEDLKAELKDKEEK